MYWAFLISCSTSSIYTYSHTDSFFRLINYIYQLYVCQNLQNNIRKPVFVLPLCMDMLQSAKANEVFVRENYNFLRCKLPFSDYIPHSLSKSWSNTELKITQTRLMHTTNDRKALYRLPPCQTEVNGAPFWLYFLTQDLKEAPAQDWYKNSSNWYSIHKVPPANHYCYTNLQSWLHLHPFMVLE